MYKYSLNLYQNVYHTYGYAMIVCMSTILDGAMSSEYSLVQKLSVTKEHKSGMFLVIKLIVMLLCKY